MASSIQLLRSNTAKERPFPGNLLDGQPALNTNSEEPGLFFKASDGSIVKIGPAAITSDGNPPNAGGTGQLGNTIGELWLDKSVNPPILKVYDGTQWVNAGSGGGGQVTLLRWSTLATAGQIVLSGVDSSSQQLAYTAGLEEVYVNGAFLRRGVDYTANNGSTIIISASLSLNDEVTVMAWTPFVIGSQIVNANVASNAGIESSKLVFLQSGTNSVSRTVDSRLKDVLSIKDFGAVGDGVTDDTAAFNAVEALPGTAPIFMPAGQYATTKGFYDLLNKKYEGPGQARLGGYYQAPERSFITTPQPIPSTDRTQIFNNGFPKASRASYMFVGSGANPSPLPTIYTNFAEWSQDIIIHDFAAGFNTDPGDHQLGRSGAFVNVMRLYHGGQGDLVARNFYGEVYSNRSGATHFLANPALIVEGGNLGVSGPSGAGCYLNHSEYIFSDNGQPVACIDRVRNYIRTNNGNALSQVWIHDRPQSGGSQPIDAFYTPAGTGRRGFDVTPADFGADKAAICLKSGDRIYFNSSAAPDPLGATWFATSLGDTYANFGGGSLNFTVGGNSTLAVSASGVTVNSTTGGLLLPRMTTAQRNIIAGAQNGLLIYNTTTDKIQARAAGVWVDLH
jgi:hypothetical protein